MTGGAANVAATRSVVAARTPAAAQQTTSGPSSSPNQVGVSFYIHKPTPSLGLPYGTAHTKSRFWARVPDPLHFVFCWQALRACISSIALTSSDTAPVPFPARGFRVQGCPAGVDPRTE